MSTNEAALDGVLDELTEALVRLSGEALIGARVVAASPTGEWELAAWVDEDTLAVDLIPKTMDVFDGLDDYQLALLYGLGFVDEDGDDTETPVFRQEFEYEPGEEWEEQAIRELALLALGLLRDVLRCAADGYHVYLNHPS